MSEAQRNVPDLYPAKSMMRRVEPGGVEIDSCLIVSPRGGTVDVTALVTNVMIYEDIMAPFITGTLSILDATALAEVLPLMGEELLYMSIFTPGFQGDLYRRNMAFALYKMEKRENVKLKAV